MKFYLLFSLVFGTPFFKNKKNLSGEYVSFWGQTLWTYKFKSNGSYIYKTSGHFGNSKTIGRYSIQNDTIFLVALPSSKQSDPKSYFKADTLLKYSQTCFVGLRLGYEYCKTTGKTIETSRRRDVYKKGMPVIE